jgi:hypothetical protein
MDSQHGESIQEGSCEAERRLKAARVSPCAFALWSYSFH